MRNTLAIAQREVSAYFVSPIAYVLIGFFALLFGWFFYVPLAFFVEQSGQMGMNPTQALNMNQMLVGPTLMNTTVIMLFPANVLTFTPDWAPTRPVRLGEAMGTLIESEGDL